MRVWDLTTGTPIGDPLTGHTSPVSAVATAVLPDGRPSPSPAATTRTVRIWDLDLPDRDVGYPVACLGGRDEAWLTVSERATMSLR